MEHPIDVARKTVDGFNSGDFESLRDLHTSDYVEEEYATGRTAVGVDSAIEVAKGWKQAFPDAKATVTGAYADGPIAVLEIRYDGTNSGPMTTPDGQEIPATGRRVSVQACQVFDFEGDRIKASRNYFDLNSMLEQLGLGAGSRAAVSS